MLKDMDEKGAMREMNDIDYRSQFDKKWKEFPPEEQQAINAEITRVLDALRDSPDLLWGSIMNTSIEGGKVNPFNGLRGDWTGTPWEPIWERHGRSDQQAALFLVRSGSSASSNVRGSSGLVFEARTTARRFRIDASTFQERPTSFRA